jgi:hypothetical protein
MTIQILEVFEQTNSGCSFGIVVPMNMPPLNHLEYLFKTISLAVLEAVDEIIC